MKDSAIGGLLLVLLLSGWIELNFWWELFT